MTLSYIKPLDLFSIFSYAELRLQYCRVLLGPSLAQLDEPMEFTAPSAVHVHRQSNAPHSL
jgi:hypothetical protein